MFVDANYYYSWYNDFIGYLVAADIKEDPAGGANKLLGVNEVYRIATNAQETGTFKDNRDGHIYKTVQIGNQLWMA